MAKTLYKVTSDAPREDLLKLDPWEMHRRIRKYEYDNSIL